MKVYIVNARTKSANLTVQSGPFASRQEAERMAVETAKRTDVQPEVTISTREVADDDSDE
jgi:hypothetical protein